MSGFCGKLRHTPTPAPGGAALQEVRGGRQDAASRIGDERPAFQELVLQCCVTLYLPNSAYALIIKGLVGELAPAVGIEPTTN